MWGVRVQLHAFLISAQDREGVVSFISRPLYPRREVPGALLCPRVGLGYLRVVFLNDRALASIIPGRERPEETTICCKVSLVQRLITNLHVILYLSTCHTVYISVLILFMIMS